MAAFEVTSKETSFSIMDNTPLLLPLYVCQVVWFDSWACCITPFPLTSPQAVDYNSALGEPPQSERESWGPAAPALNSHGWVQVQKAFCVEVCQLLLIFWHNKDRNQCLIGHAPSILDMSFKIVLKWRLYITCIWVRVKRILDSSELISPGMQKNHLKCRIAEQVSQVE